MLGCSAVRPASCFGRAVGVGGAWSEPCAWWGSGAGAGSGEAAPARGADCARGAVGADVASAAGTGAAAVGGGASVAASSLDAKNVRHVSSTDVGSCRYFSYSSSMSHALGPKLS
jgi:hypothetical protein